MNKELVQSIDHIKKHSEVCEEFSEYCSNNCKSDEFPESREVCIKYAIWYMLDRINK